MLLTVCKRGNVRSVSLASILKDLKGEMDVLAIGIETSSTDFLQEMIDRASLVIGVGDDNIRKKLEILVDSSKLCFVDVGDDIWGVPMNPLLVDKIIKNADFMSSMSNANGYTETTYLSAVQSMWNKTN